jgi:hypothetical protein
VEAVARRELEHGVDRSGRTAVEREAERVLIPRVGSGRSGGEDEERGGGSEQDEDASQVGLLIVGEDGPS